MSLDVANRIVKAKIQLQKSYPFWAYLSLFLKFKKIEKGKMLCDTMGVDCVTGEVYYVKEFIESLSDSELVGVIAHEINHIAFLSQLRQDSRDSDGWNCATDLSINSLLKLNGFKLAKGGIIPDYNDELNIGNGKKITKCSEKTAEEIYDLFPKIKKKKTTYIISDGKGKGEELGEGFDVHIKGKEGKVLTPKEKKALIESWNGKLQEALIIAKMKGDVPIGMERLIGKLHENKINWRTLLQRYIMNSFPSNHTYQTPHKKSRSIGCYMPNILKEKIEISVMVDLSGSVGKEELTDFMSELIGMAKAFQDKLEMRVFSHDTECYDNGLITNGNIEKLKSMSLKGGGGTSFLNPLKYLEENNIKPKCLIWLTDGYGDEIEKSPFDILWVLSKGGSDDLLKKVGRVIKLED